MPFFLVVARDNVGGPFSAAFVEAETARKAVKYSQDEKDEVPEIATCVELQLDRVSPEFVALVMSLVDFSKDFDEGIGGLLSEAIRAGYEIGQKED